MTKGEVLKRLLGADKVEDEYLLVIVNGDLDTIEASDAVRIWEKLNEEMPGTKKEPEKKKAPEKAAPKKKPLDDKKMLALRKAGWSYEKIADEMKCAVQTVINHIREME